MMLFDIIENGMFFDFIKLLYHYNKKDNILALLEHIQT